MNIRHGLAVTLGIVAVGSLYLSVYPTLGFLAHLVLLAVAIFATAIFADLILSLED